MTKRFQFWYLILAPVFFLLSWYIGQRLHEHFIENAQGLGVQPNRSLWYAIIFTSVYLAAFLVIKDLYPNKEKK
ncbi:MAG: hypothetical protein RLY35_1491 [Bacteroidota bacterium]|jgi:hypothetical protein